MTEVEIAFVHNYYGKIGVAAIEMTNGELSIGETIHIKGTTTDFTTKVSSLQIEHQNVEKARKGDMVGIKVAEKVRVHDKIFKITE